MPLVFVEVGHELAYPYGKWDAEEIDPRPLLQSGESVEPEIPDDEDAPAGQRPTLPDWLLHPEPVGSHAAIVATPKMALIG